MAKKQQPAWQFKLTMTLSIVMLLLIFGYFSQSFLEIRKVKPVSVAIERIIDSSVRPHTNSKLIPVTGAEEKSTADH
ncbi:MAG: hypothetical protein KAJ32_04395 [Gammaproteobacteria bacterium]|nr:hypothetical protein [Gammaproteobacteria bacterium]